MNNVSERAFHFSQTARFQGRALCDRIADEARHPHFPGPVRDLTGLAPGDPGDFEARPEFFQREKPDAVLTFQNLISSPDSRTMMAPSVKTPSTSMAKSRIFLAAPATPPGDGGF